MKPIYIIILILSISGSLFSQNIQYSLNSGNDYSFISNDVKHEGKLGFHINGGIAFPLNKRISLKSGLGINQLNVKFLTEITYFSGTSLDLIYNLIVLNVPIQIQTSFFQEKLLVSTGISVSTILYDKNKLIFIDPQLIKYIPIEDFKRVFLNLGIGAKYRIYKKVYFGFSYEYSVSSIDKNKIQNLNNASFNISYLF